MRPAWLPAAVLLVLVSALVRAAPPRAPQRADGDAEHTALYQKGMKLYASGYPEKALRVFKQALRQNPHDRSARAAVVRIYTEIAIARLPKLEVSEPPTLSDSIDDFLIVDVPQFYDFGSTIGDGLADAGTLVALNGRAAQLLAERRVAMAQGRAFVKEGELRSLVRRLPTVIG